MHNINRAGEQLERHRDNGFDGACVIAIDMTRIVGADQGSVRGDNTGEVAEQFDRKFKQVFAEKAELLREIIQGKKEGQKIVVDWNRVNPAYLLFYVALVSEVNEIPPINIQRHWRAFSLNEPDNALVSRLIMTLSGARPEPIDYSKF